MTLSEIFARIHEVAIEMSKDRNISIDADIISELLFERCMHMVVNDMMNEPEGLYAFRRQVTLNFTAGVAPIPEGVKEEFFEDATFLDDLDASRYWDVREYFQGLSGGLVPYTTGRFAVYNNQVRYAAKGTALGALTGTRDVMVPKLPVITGLDENDELDIREDILQRIIHFTAAVIIGDIRLNALGAVSLEKDDEE